MATRGEERRQGLIPNIFSTILPRNTVIPASRSRLSYTMHNNQKLVRSEVSQGENLNAEDNIPLGSLEVAGLPAQPAGDVAIEVQFSIDLNGILTVTACETSSGRQEQRVVNDAGTQRFASHQLERSRDLVESLFAALDREAGEGEAMVDPEAELEA